ncbi:GatB/YqeY domain-containing protein [Savagea sp. SN6]|uniref:GatB/YqeY domain-containing protein n=1 Tax=Savagea serpentis TaxID=2785297 RepID=A0A8J7G5C0_9BACL|nr:GatB/YqeY domain-containing protein [Savagea serpentis]MBF4500626.1 GatB/YqeY domain-containing protein [Savagea serpentis]
MLKTKVFEMIKQAMRDKDQLTKSVLTIVKSNLDLAEKEKGEALTEAEEIAIINREMKQVNQSLDGAKQAGRDDLIEQEEAKLRLLEQFLPEQLSEEEVKEALAEAGVTSGMNMGDAMKIARPLLAGKADGKTIASVVKQLIR